MVGIRIRIIGWCPIVATVRMLKQTPPSGASRSGRGCFSCGKSCAYRRCALCGCGSCANMDGRESGKSCRWKDMCSTSIRGRCLSTSVWVSCWGCCCSVCSWRASGDIIPEVRSYKISTKYVTLKHDLIIIMVVSLWSLPRKNLQGSYMFGLHLIYSDRLTTETIMYWLTLRATKSVHYILNYLMNLVLHISRVPSCWDLMTEDQFPTQ